MVPRAPMGLHGHHPGCTPPRLWEVIETAPPSLLWKRTDRREQVRLRFLRRAAGTGTRDAGAGLCPPAVRGPSASPSSRTHSQTGASGSTPVAEVAAKTFPFSLPIRIDASPLPGRQAARPFRPRSVLSAGPQGWTDSRVTGDRASSLLRPPAVR